MPAANNPVSPTPATARPTVGFTVMVAVPEPVTWALVTGMDSTTVPVSERRMVTSPVVV